MASTMGYKRVSRDSIGCSLLLSRVPGTKNAPWRELHGGDRAKAAPPQARTCAGGSRFPSVLLPERLAGQGSALHLRHSFSSFSRVTSTHSPIRSRTPESVTPSASLGFFLRASSVLLNCTGIPYHRPGGLSTSRQGRGVSKQRVKGSQRKKKGQQIRDGGNDRSLCDSQTGCRHERKQ